MANKTTKLIVAAIRAGTKRRKAKKKRHYPYPAAGAAATKFCDRHGATPTRKEPGEEVVKTFFSLYTLEWGAYYQGFLEGYGAALKGKR